MIEHLEIRGLKVPVASVDLGRLTAILGPVGVGKSAIAESIQFAALGCVPRVGRTDAATAALMRDDAIQVDVCLAGDRAFTRSLTRVGARLQGSAAATWLPPRAKITECAESIRGLFGASDSEAAENLDIVRLLSVSGPELAKRIELLLDSGGLAAESRIARGREIWRGRLDAAREDRDGLRLPIDPDVAAAAERIVAIFDAEVAESIVHALEWARSEKLRTADAAKRSVAARAAIETRQMSLRAPAEGRKALEARKAEASARRTQLTTTEQIYCSAKHARASAETEVADATEAQARAAEALSRATEDAKAIDAIRADHDAIEDPPEVPAPEPVAPSAEAIALADRLEAEAREIEETAQQLLDSAPIAPSSAEAEAAVRIAERELAHAQASPWRQVEEHTKALEADLLRFAPPHDDGWIQHIQSILRLAEENGGHTGRWTLILEEARAKVAELAVQAETAARARATAAADAAELRRRATARCVSAKAAREEALRGASAANNLRQVAYRDARTSRNSTLAYNASRRRELLEQIRVLEAALRIAEIRKADADRRATGARQRLAGLRDAIEVDEVAVRTEIAAIEVELADLDPKIRACRDADALLDEMDRLAAAIASASAENKAFAAAEWAIQRLRDEDMASRRGGLEARMTAFLRAAGRQEDPFLRTARGGCEFGWRSTGGYEVMVEALSGGQGVLFRAALAYAIVTTRAPELRVICLELAEACDGQTEQAILRACETLVDAQWIVATCVPIAVPPGWTTIRVEMPVGQEAEA